MSNFRLTGPFGQYNGHYRPQDSSEEQRLRARVERLQGLLREIKDVDGSELHLEFLERIDAELGGEYGTR